MTEPTPLPDTPTLHQMVREGGHPQAFIEARMRVSDAATTLATERLLMHGLIREAHRQGIGPSALARWSGYHRNTVNQILSDT